MSTAIVIPARLKSTRFPAKALIDMDGRPLIRRVFDICQTFGYDTYVLTDSQEIANEITKSNVIMTSEDCQNGTDRIMSVIGNELHYDKYINVQGDVANPDIAVVKAIEKALDDHYVIQAHKELKPEHQADPTVCKMIHTNGLVHWIGRSAQKYGDFALGYAGYTPEGKERWDTFTEHEIERLETMEGLRWIQNGDTLKTVRVEDPYGIEINEPKDYEHWKKLYK
mgnify:CR=1 FL=1